MATHADVPIRGTVTRKDVARFAGVSTAVVSYVVNNGPKNVAPATAARVNEAIRMLGYRPNAAARALKRGSSELVGLIVPESSNSFFAHLAHAVEEETEARGYGLVLANSEAKVEKERRHVRALASRQVDGVLLASVLFEPDLTELKSADIPSVLLNKGTPADGFSSVGVDLRTGGRIAVEHLVEHGHRSIGLVIGSNTDGATDGRETGWLEALTAAGLPEGPIGRGLFSREGGYAAAERILNAAERPTAVFVSSDLQAVGVLRAFYEAGVRVPEDIALVSFDGSPEAEFTWPPLTTVQQPIAAMAAAAVSALLADKDDNEPRHRMFPVELVVRRSCGCPPSS